MDGCVGFGERRGHHLRRLRAELGDVHARKVWEGVGRGGHRLEEALEGARERGRREHGVRRRARAPAPARVELCELEPLREVALREEARRLELRHPRELLVDGGAQRRDTLRGHVVPRERGEDAREAVDEKGVLEEGRLAVARGGGVLLRRGRPARELGGERRGARFAHAHERVEHRFEERLERERVILARRAHSLALRLEHLEEAVRPFRDGRGRGEVGGGRGREALELVAAALELVEEELARARVALRHRRRQRRLFAQEAQHDVAVKPEQLGELEGDEAAGRRRQHLLDPNLERAAHALKHRVQDARHARHRRRGRRGGPVRRRLRSGGFAPALRRVIIAAVEERRHHLLLRRERLVQKGEHVAHVAHGVVRVHLDRARDAAGAAARERRDEAAEERVVALARHLVRAVFVQHRALVQDAHRALERRRHLGRVALHERRALALHPPAQPLVRRLLILGDRVHELQPRALVVRPQELLAVAVDRLHPPQRREEAVAHLELLQRSHLVRRELVRLQEGGDHRRALLAPP
mmetsp:Transcript_17398/g.56964  ORF Transcript_17398/g.56964 Transcript_17398/m.56964 type:complete len:530 (+) Transcript_17398:84-1673(+)